MKFYMGSVETLEGRSQELSVGYRVPGLESRTFKPVTNQF